MPETKNNIEEGLSLSKLDDMGDVETMEELTRVIYSTNKILKDKKSGSKEKEEAVQEIENLKGHILKYSNTRYIRSSKRAARNTLKVVWKTYQRRLKMYGEIPKLSNKVEKQKVGGLEKKVTQAQQKQPAVKKKDPKTTFYNQLIKFVSEEKLTHMPFFLKYVKDSKPLIGQFGSVQDVVKAYEKFKSSVFSPLIAKQIKTEKGLDYVIIDNPSELTKE